MNKEREITKRELAWSDIEVLSFDEKARTVDYVMSDESVDSYGEIVEQVWRLERFMKAPIVLYAHNRAQGNHWGEGTIPQEQTFPIGKVIKGPKVEGNKKQGTKRLVGTVLFAPPEVNEFADKVFRQVISGFMPCGSVGFYPHDVRREKHEDAERYVLSDNELFEFSPCPIGANMNAVANSMEDPEKRRQYLERRSAECAQKTIPFPPSEPEPQPAASDGQENNTMNEAEMKAKLAELEGQLETVRASEKSARETAQANERAVAEATERANAATAERDAARAELATASESVVTLTAERDEAKSARDAIETDLIEVELQALVGVKFHAAELDDMREDRKSLGKEKFAERMSRRAALSTGKQIIPEDPTPPEFTKETPGAGLSAKLKEQAHTA